MSDLTKKKAEALFNGAMNMFGSPSSKAAVAASTADVDAKGSGRLATTATMESNPEDIPKEDLLHLCMKMNKRMQSMETKGQELVKIKAVLLAERKQLIDAIKQVVTIPVNPLDDNEFDIGLAIDLLNKSEENQRVLVNSLEQKISDLEQSKMVELLECENRHRKEITNLQRSFNKPASNSTETAEESVDAGASGTTEDLITFDISLKESDYTLQENERLMKEIEEMQANQINLTGKIKKLESQYEEGKASESSLQSTIAVFEEKLRLRNEELLADRRKNEELRVKAEEKVMYLQLQINNVKGREEQMNTDSITLKKEAEKMKEMISERELIIAQRKELIEKLQNKLFENENDIGSFRQRILETEKNLTAAKLLKDEKDALLSSLRKDMRAMFDSKEQAILRVQELEEYKLKRESIEVKVVDMDTQIDILQASVEDKNTLMTRLKGEAAVMERTLGLKTAALLSAETNLGARDKEREAMKKELAAQTESLFQALNKIKACEATIEALEAELIEKSKIHENEKKNAETKENNLIQKHENQLTEIKLNSEERLEAMKKENSKKSSLARTLLTEREEENRFLRTKNEELVLEIKSGSPNDRRIFELAEIQAKREAVHGQHGSNRELAFQQLQSTLAKKDFELAKLQQNQSNLVAEISELRRHTKREGVNLDYLKNIVLQYMSFPLQSPEKSSLVPVIATLLQFNAKELEQVMKDPLWGNRPVKEVKRALSKASASSIRTTEPSVESNEPLLVEDGGENKDIRPLDGPSRIHHDSALEFECEDEGVTVGGSR